MMKGISKFLAAGILLLAGFGAQAATYTYEFDGILGEKWFINPPIAVAAGDTFAEEWHFLLNKDVTMTFKWSTLASDPDSPFNGVEGAAAALYSGWGTSGTELYSNPGLAVPQDVVTFSAYLLPGEYTMTLSGLGIFDEGGAYGAKVEVSSVPVPGAAILFGSAVMAFGFVSRRRKGIAA
ncbi:MAG: hypothetical protein RPU59_12080 [Candidatus Sedimenticola sp. (ex Thyasira tokunagai)]